MDLETETETKMKTVLAYSNGSTGTHHHHHQHHHHHSDEDVYVPHIERPHKVRRVRWKIIVFVAIVILAVADLLFFLL